ncbi:MAG: Panacea domain-containing protein [bacterium]
MTNITMQLNNIHREKLLNAILLFSRKTKCPSLVKMFKLLFFLDFYHFKLTGRTVTDLDYYALPFGPVPTDFYNEIKDGTVPPDMDHSFALVPLQTERGTPAFEFKSKKPADLSVFSPREQKLLDDLAFAFKDITPSQMTEISHLKNQPWDKTIKGKGANTLIDYMLAIDNEATISMDDARAMLIEHREMAKNFSVKHHLSK